MPLPIAIGADHAGFAHKESIRQFLEKQGHTILDLGTYSLDSVDYPDFAHAVALAVENGQATYGVLVCGSGEGVCMTANKHAGIRAALVWQPEVAKLTRQHNNANVICLPARFMSEEVAQHCVSDFLATDFEGGRHAQRVEKISC
jgi:ribose 5-phosphate isomerase B